MTMRTITRLYDNPEDATHVVQALEAAGVPHADISLVSNNADGRYDGASPMSGSTTGGSTVGTGAMMDSGSTLNSDSTMGSGGTMGSGTGSSSTGLTSGDPEQGASTGAGTGASLGTVLGGGAGLLAGLGMLAIPGVGPIVAAGWLIATLTGAGVGAAAGGLVGSLTGAGVSEADAQVHAEGVRRGGTLVTVRTDDSMASTVDAVLDGRSAVDLTTRRSEYEAEGWKAHDPASPAYTPEQVTTERKRRVVSVS
jgi:hypothetical protein